MAANNTRLLVAVDINSSFPGDFRRYVEKSAADTFARVIYRIIDHNVIDAPQMSKTGEISETPTKEFDRSSQDSVVYQDRHDCLLESPRSQRAANISLQDMMWANSYLIVAPVYHGNLSPKVRDFLEVFSNPLVRKNLRHKTVSAMTVSRKLDENYIDLLKNIYNDFIGLGSIVVPAGLSDRAVLSSAANAYGYRQVIGEKVEEYLVDRQIQRLVNITSSIHA